MSQIIDVPGIGRVEFPDGMSDEEIVAAIQRNMQPEQGQQPLGQRVGRQLGLTARHAVEGLAAIPAMVAQPVADVADRGFAAAGSDFRFGNQQQGVSNLLTRMGLPEPANSMERVVGAGSQALAAGGGVVGVAQRVSNPIANMLAQAPGLQAAGAAGGGASAGYAGERGANPLGQMAAGLVGGFGGVGAATGANALATGLVRGARASVQPFTQGGRNAIASRILQEQARDPRSAAQRLELSRELVDGSIPTSGPASRDVGLIALEKGLRSRSSAEFGARTSEQNLARQRQLDRIAGTEADIVDARAAREAGTASAREAALAGNPQVNTAPILARADEILAGPAGARQTVRRAVTQFRDAIENETDAARLYEIRKDIGDALGGRLAGDRADYKLASRELIAMREALDGAIDEVAPGFSAYLARYRDMSRPINQMEALQELQRRSAMAAPDITTGRDFLSQAQFTRNLGNMLRDPDIVRDLTPEQIATARAVAADLDMASAINASNIRAPGSDTFQNLSLANVIAMGTGRGGNVAPAVRTIPGLGWLFKHTDDDINRLLMEAMLDPQLAAQMLRTPTRMNVDQLALPLAVKARQLGIGAAVGSTTTTQPPQP